jgi:formate/nitrite transporter FocA (FNT family)
VSGRDPEDIWEEGLDEGERRLKRNAMGLAASGFAGGAEVAFGILAVSVVVGALSGAVPEQLGHVIGSMFFGIAFVLITIGRAELFTENFHIPVGAVFAKRAPISALGRMWLVTLIFNLIGMAFFIWLYSVDGVLKAPTLEAAGPTADTFAERALLPAFVSAIIAGTVITVFTWVIAAADSGITRVVLSLLTGFVLVAPSLNHAVVGFGKILFGMVTDTSTATSADLWRNLAVSIVGNFIGGVGIVFAVRLAQVRGEPGGGGSGKRPSGSHADVATSQARESTPV